MCVCVCVCVLPGSFRGMGAFYFKIENRRDILNATLLTKIIAHEQKKLFLKFMLQTAFLVIRS